VVVYLMAQFGWEVEEVEFVLYVGERLLVVCVVGRLGVGWTCVYGRGCGTRLTGSPPSCSPRP